MVHGHDGPECPRCGIVLANDRPTAAAPAARRKTAFRTGRPIAAWFSQPDGAIEPAAFGGRVLLFAVLLWLGWKLVRSPLEANYAGESFLHLVNLPFHEAGHVMFMPFGRFMMFVGGSLGQLLMPLVCLVAFLLKTRDPFGASVALWWLAENFMDIAPYVNDARTLELPLLGGMTGKETDGHDWEHILGMLGWLRYDRQLAQAFQSAGIGLMGLSLLWAGALLWRQYRLLAR